MSQPMDVMMSPGGRSALRSLGGNGGSFQSLLYPGAFSKAAGAKRYRCHTGHSFTGQTLLTSQSEKIEEILWISLRMFEERKNLLTSMAMTARGTSKSMALQRAKETQGHIDRIRTMLLDPRSNSAEDMLTRVKGVMAEPRKAKSAR